MRIILVALFGVLLPSIAAAQGAETFSGSGVVIGTNGEILTNSHVVENCKTIAVRFPSEPSESAALVARDQKNDLAVIRTKNPHASVAAFREGIPIRAGDAVVALGYPLSGLLATTANVSVGIVSALAGIGDDSRYLQISAPVQPGNSGGPLLDRSGHLIAIVTAKLNAMRVARFTGDLPQNVNFAIKADVAKAFLDSRGITHRTARSDRQLSAADVGDIARPFTVYIECRRAAVPSAIAETRQPSQALLPPVSPPTQEPERPSVWGALQRIITPGNVTGARLLEQGIYSGQLKTEEKTGKTISTGYKLVKAGQAIDSGGFELSQFDDGLPRVGFWWYLDGTPVGKNVQVKIVRIDPDGTEHGDPWDRTLGRKAWNGMRVKDWQAQVGKTSFQIWYGNKKLMETSFDIK
jgi:hypothetical protein